MELERYIHTELLILVPVMYMIGMGLKKSKIADKKIPLWVFATENLESGREIAAAFFTAVTQGVLAAGASVYANQLHIQAKKDK